MHDDLCLLWFVQINCNLPHLIADEHLSSSTNMRNYLFEGFVPISSVFRSVGQTWCPLFGFSRGILFVISKWLKLFGWLAAWNSLSRVLPRHEMRCINYISRSIMGVYITAPLCLSFVTAWSSAQCFREMLIEKNHLKHCESLNTVTKDKHDDAEKAL